jgi:hypothetical protein
MTSAKDSQNSSLSQPESSLLGRRTFLGRSGVAALALTTGAALLGGTRQAKSATPPNVTTADILNFALNLEYLEAEYLFRGLTGGGFEANGFGDLVTGAGYNGSVTVIKASKVDFTNPIYGQFIQEMTTDELNHTVLLRQTLAAAGVTPVARPVIDLYNSFNSLAQAAGIGPTFNPFENEDTFIVGLLWLEETGVTAYNGAIALLSELDPVATQTAGKIVTVEGYHAGVIRTLIISAGNPYITDANLGTVAKYNLGNGKDQQLTFSDGTYNFVPADAQSLAYARTTDEVLHVVYGNTSGTPGGFFPFRLNGTIG